MCDTTHLRKSTLALDGYSGLQGEAADSCM
jgi:hypothetical protein